MSQTHGRLCHMGRHFQSQANHHALQRRGLSYILYNTLQPAPLSLRIFFLSSSTISICFEWDPLFLFQFCLFTSYNFISFHVCLTTVFIWNDLDERQNWRFSFVFLPIELTHNGGLRPCVKLLRVFLGSSITEKPTVKSTCTCINHSTFSDDTQICRRNARKEKMRAR